MKKIALVGEKYSLNMGEPLLFDCTEYLLKKETMEELEIIHLDWYARKTDKDDWKYPILCKVLNKISQKVKINQTLLNYFNHIFFEFSLYKKEIKKYFKYYFKDVDEVIIIGAGTIKYDARLNFAPYYRIVTDVAEKYNIPCFVNCAGIESKYNEKDIRCKMMSDALSSNSMKIVYTRDDIDELNKYIHNFTTKTFKIADVAIWCSEVFGIKKDETSNVIGIGVITPERFSDFGRNITPEMYKNEILSLLKQIESRNEKWMLFNNGDYVDKIFAEQICQELNYNPEEYIKTPTTPQELLEIVSGFKGIITSRLHSCITAYSLDIPFVAITWNNKLKYFAENLNCEERIIDFDRLNSELILSIFDKALIEGYDKDFRDSYKKTNLKAINEFLSFIK